MVDLELRSIYLPETKDKIIWISSQVGMVRFGLVWFFKGFWRTQNWTIGLVQNGQVLVLKWSKL